MLPWIEKYRPQKIDEVLGNNELKLILNNILTYNIKMPHFIFYGPPGNGKTSTILAFAHELYGNSFNANVLQLNASINKGIESVRNIIKNFIKNKTTKNEKNINYTMIILDEADALTIDAQTSLRKIIEDNTETTKFCIICNYISKITYPIISRCLPIYFKSLSTKNIITQLKYIISQENMIIDNNIINSIIETCNNDMRKSIGLLQTLKYYYTNSFKITPQLIYDINFDISNKTVIEIFNDIKTKNYMYVYNKIIVNNIPLKKLCEKMLLLCDLNLDEIISILKIIENINLDANIKIQTLNLIFIFQK